MLHTRRRCFGCVSTCVSAITAVHDAGIPWYASIAATTVGLRTALIPATLLARRASARLASAGPAISHINNLFLKASNKSRAVKLYTKAIHATLKVHQANPLTAVLLVPAVQIPAFVTYALSVRDLCDNGEGFDSGGILWFQDLSIQDPTWLLPIAGVSSAYFNLRSTKSSEEMQRESLSLQLAARHLAQLLLITAIPVTLQLPTGFLVYWITSTA